MSIDRGEELVLGEEQDYVPPIFGVVIDDEMLRLQKELVEKAPIIRPAPPLDSFKPTIGCEPSRFGWPAP